MADSAAAARAEIHDTLTAAKTMLAAAGVERIYEYTPGLFSERCVMINLVGMTADDYRLEVTIYRTAKLDADHVTAQGEIDRMVTAVDTALYANAVLSAPNWTIGYDPERQVYGAVGSIEVPREDTHYS